MQVKIIKFIKSKLLNTIKNFDTKQNQNFAALIKEVLLVSLIKQ